MCGVKIVIVTDFACVCVRCVGFFINSFFLSWFHYNNNIILML